MYLDCKEWSKQLPIRSILAVTDFSIDSGHAAHRAAMVASEVRAEKAVLLHVIEKSWMDSLKDFLSPRGEIEDNIVKKAFHALARIIQEGRKRTGYALEPQVCTGNTLDEIIRAASEFDLLVLGARGIHRVRSLALGTTSQRLLSKLHQPVLVVKRKPGAEYRNVLVATDFSQNSARALACSRSVSPNALISLVHVFEPLAEKKMRYAGASEDAIETHRVKAHLDAEEQMTRFLENVGMAPGEAFRHVEYGHAPAKLLDIVLTWNPDLVVVGKHGGSRIEELLLGSVTRHMLAQSRSDVLVA